MSQGSKVQLWFASAAQPRSHAEEILWEIVLKVKKDKIIASSRRVETRLSSSSQIQEHKKQYRKTKPKKEEVVKGERRPARIIL